MGLKIRVNRLIIISMETTNIRLKQCTMLFHWRETNKTKNIFLFSLLTVFKLFWPFILDNWSQKI